MTEHGGDVVYVERCNGKVSRRFAAQRRMYDTDGENSGVCGYTVRPTENQPGGGERKRILPCRDFIFAGRLSLKMSENNKYTAQIRNQRNRSNGRIFEELISKACVKYTEMGVAEIEKTPEPMKPIKNMGNGRFMAYYEKAAQPDYKGTLKDGRSFVMEAKHTETGRLNQRAVTEEQSLRMDKHMALNAGCCVLVSFGMREFALIPWNIFRDMKNIWGHKYVEPEDIRQYSVKIKSGIIDFLEVL